MLFVRHQLHYQNRVSEGLLYIVCRRMKSAAERMRVHATDFGPHGIVFSFFPRSGVSGTYPVLSVKMITRQTETKHHRHICSE